MRKSHISFFILIFLTLGFSPAYVSAQDLKGLGTYKTETINLPCNNAGFESGTTAAWDGWWGQAGQQDNTGFCPTHNCPPYVYPGFSPTQHVIMSGNGYDPLIGGNLLPVVCPTGGTYSLRLGDLLVGNQSAGVPLCDYSATSSKFARVSQTFKVSALNPNFIYKYAVVLEDPQDDKNHVGTARPYLSIRVFDQNGNVTNCGQYDVIVQPGLNGFNLAHQPPIIAECPCQPFSVCPPAGSSLDPVTGQVIQRPRDLYWKNWTTIVIPLSAYIGQNVTVQFTVQDCMRGGHLGYAYIDGDCFPRLMVKKFCSSDSIIGPADGVTYTWTGPGIVGPGNTPGIKVNKSGKYSLSMLSVLGTCPAVFDTIVTIGQPSDTASFKAPAVCEGSPTSFKDLSGPQAGITGWTWDFGGGNTSTVQNPTYTFPKAGTYPVKLTVDWGGCGDDTTINIIVNPKPKPGFTFASSCTATVTFSDGSTGGPIQSWAWNFGDNGTSTLTDPSHTYAALGSYTVTLTVTNSAGCKDSSKTPVNLSSFISADFIPTTVCTGHPTQFTDKSAPSGGISTWNWDFGGGNTSTLQNPSFTFNAPGNFPVKLSITSGGCSDDTTLTVVVTGGPKADFSSIAKCTGNVSFTDASTGSPQSWHWNFGDNGTSTEQNPSHLYTGAGNFDVWLVVVAAGGCKDSIKKPLSIGPSIHSGFTSVTVCIGNPTSFKDTSTGAPTMFNWNFGEPASASNTSTAQNPTHTYNASGTYTVTYSASIPGGCFDTVKQAVIVVDKYKADFSSNSGCLGAATTFTDASTVGVGAWSWDFGDAGSAGNTSTLQNPTHIYNTVGTYTVTLTISGGGCGDNIKKPVTISVGPSVSFTAKDTAGCMPLCIGFIDASTSTTGTIANWNWDFGDGTSSTVTSPTHCYKKAGDFSPTLSITSSGGCSVSYTYNKKIHVYPIPAAAFNLDPAVTTPKETTVHFTDQSTGAASWHWHFGDGDSTQPSNPNPSHTYPSDVEATYIATLIVYNKYGCLDSVQHPIVVKDEPEWTFYVPNCITPNGDGKNDVFFSRETGVTDKEMWIFDRWGNQIYYTHDLYGVWDGRVQGGASGEPAQEDTYVWLIKITEVFGKSHRYIGRVSIVK